MKMTRRWPISEKVNHVGLIKVKDRNVSYLERARGSRTRFVSGGRRHMQSGCMIGRVVIIIIIILVVDGQNSDILIVVVVVVVFIGSSCSWTAD